MEARLEPPVSLRFLRSNVGPLDDVVLAFSDGVTALYGLNGAGKSQVLQALRDAVLGVQGSFRGRGPGGTQLFCELPPGSGAYDRIEQILTGRDYRRLSHDEETARAVRERLAAAARAWLQNGSPAYEPGWDTAQRTLISRLSEELGWSSTFCFMPTGRAEGGWDVWLCAPADRAAFPACAQAVAEYEEVRAEYIEFAADRERRFLEAEEAAEEGRISEAEYAAAMRRDEEAQKERDNYVHWLLSQPVASWLWTRPYEHELDPEVIVAAIEPLIDDARPVPMAFLGHWPQKWRFPLRLVTDDDTEDVDVVTSTGFVSHAGVELLQSIGDEKQVSWEALFAGLERYAATIEAAANETYARLLLDAPRLTCSVRPPGQWIGSGPALRWSHPGTGLTRDLGVDALSAAQGRWARFAIRWELQTSHANTLVVIDEPEAALHRSAEEHVARGLSNLGLAGAQVVVATHSPEVMNDSSTLLYEVKMNPSGTSARPLAAPERESLERLGLRPSDLLRRWRVILLVEGEHDEIVLNTLCGQQLAEARARVIALRGGSKLPGTVESQMLFDFTDAHLVALLDNVDAATVSSVWREAQERHLTATADEAVAHLVEGLRASKAEELRWITEWLSRALKRGVAGRVEPFGLVARDVIEYLPVDLLVPGAGGATWAELRAEHDALRGTLAPGKDLRDFKTWLRKHKGASFSSENIRRAAEAVTNVPEELRRLGYRVRELAARPR